MPDMTDVRVKALEWRKPDPDDIQDRSDDCQLVATGFGGQYAISTRQLVRTPSPDRTGFLLWDAADAFSFTEHLTVKDAKAVAQADYERRILAALDAALTPGEDIPACTGCGEYPGENVAMLVASLSAKLAAVERERDEAETERTDMMWQRRRAEESAQAIQDELAALSGPAADMLDYHEGIVLAVQSRTKAAEARADRLERQNRQMVKALRFYASERRYNGANQRNDGTDAFTPPNAAYIQDVTRDGGSIARALLTKTENTDD